MCAANGPLPGTLDAAADTLAAGYFDWEVYKDAGAASERDPAALFFEGLQRFKASHLMLEANAAAHRFSG